MGNMLSKILSNMSVCMYYLLDLAQQGAKRRRKWGEGPANCISCLIRTTDPRVTTFYFF